MDRAMQQGAKGGSRPIGSKKLRLSLAACKEPNAANNHVNLEASLFSVEPWLQLCEILKQSPHLNCAYTSDP